MSIEKANILSSSESKQSESDLDRKTHHTQSILYDDLKDFIIKGKICTLRSISPQDAHDIYLGASNPIVYKKRLTQQKEGYDEQDAALFIDYIDSEHRKLQKRVLGIEVEGHIVGIVSLTRNEFPYDKTAFLGVRVNPTYQGQGIAKEAVQLMSNNAKEIFYDLIRIEARLFETNSILPHILQKVGFVQEAKLHHRVVYDNNIMDEIIYAKHLDNDV